MTTEPERKAGAKPIYAAAMKTRAVRMTDEHWAKLQRLGGGDWLRAQIIKAKDKP